MKSERLQILRSMFNGNFVQSTAEPLESTLHFGGDELPLTLGNALQALVRGYKGEYRVLPDKPVLKVHDLTHLPKFGSLGWNTPPWVNENTVGKVVEFYEYEKRRGTLLRPENK